LKKVLIAVDDTRASKDAISTFFNSVQKPEEVIVLYVQRLEGKSLMADMLGEAELSTLKDALIGTEYKNKLDKKARRILDHYWMELEGKGPYRVRTILRIGIPAEEILHAAEKEEADLIILPANGAAGFSRLIGGNATRDVQKRAKVPVLVAKRPNLCEEPYSWGDASAAIKVTAAVIIGLFILGIFIQHRILM
jgi:nucleotide-binding universal stress UspA family protein